MRILGLEVRPRRVNGGWEVLVPVEVTCLLFQYGTEQVEGGKARALSVTLLDQADDGEFTVRRFWDFGARMVRPSSSMGEDRSASSNGVTRPGVPLVVTREVVEDDVTVPPAIARQSPPRGEFAAAAWRVLDKCLRHEWRERSGTRRPTWYSVAGDRVADGLSYGTTEQLAIYPPNEGTMVQFKGDAAAWLYDAGTLASSGTQFEPEPVV